MALYLRTVDSDHRAYGGFQWPHEVGAVVTAPDWSPEAECGHGLHGLLWGEEDAGYLDASEDSVFQVVEYDGEAVDLNGKHKFPLCTLRYVGDRHGAAAYILSNGGHGRAVHFAQVTGGDRSTVTGGDWSTVTGGDRSTVTGGDWSTVTGGDRSTVTGGYWSTVTGGYGSTVTGGYGSELRIRWHDGRRYRTWVGYVGEDGIEAGVAYRLTDDGRPVRA